jgi:hypothetical protein
MSDSDPDFEADLERAIALSLQQEHHTPPRRQNAKPKPLIIDLLSSDDDDDLDVPVIAKESKKDMKPKPSEQLPKKNSASNDIPAWKELRKVPGIPSKSEEASSTPKQSNTPEGLLTTPSTKDSDSSQAPTASVELLPSDETGSDSKSVLVKHEREVDSVGPLSSPSMIDLLSAKNGSPTKKYPTLTQAKTVPEKNKTLVSTPTTFGILQGLDRKKMERERLLRVNKRKRKSSQSPPQSPRRDTQRVKSTESNIQENIQKLQILPEHSTSISKADKTVGELILNNGNRRYDVISFQGQQALNTSGVQFPDGVVKKTWAYGFPRQNDIKLEEVLQKETLQIAILSAFQVEPEWVARKLKLDTKVIWVLQAQTDAEVSLKYTLG